jgi:SAM-dependent methyltransferase
VAAKLAEHYQCVKAIDVSQPMIELARRKHRDPRITFEQGDLGAVTGQYDLVVSIMTLHHVPDLLPAVGHIAELVAPGGLAVIVDGVGSHARSRQVHYFWSAVELLRGVRRSWRKFRAETKRNWVEHLMSDRFLSPVEFAAVYRQALPEVVLQPMSDAFAAVWQRPARATNDGGGGPAPEANRLINLTEPPGPVAALANEHQGANRP